MMMEESALDGFVRLWLWLLRLLGAEPVDRDPFAPFHLSTPLREGESATTTGDAAPFALADDVDISALIAEHADAAYRVALSITRDPALAEDVTQDALLKVWTKLPTFRGDAPFRSWVLRITHNTAISTIRRRREDVRDPSELPEAINLRTVDAEVQDRLALGDFMDVLDGLDPLSRSIVVLRELEGLSYDEIAEALEIPVPTVKTRLLRSRRKLAVALEGWSP